MPDEIKVDEYSYCCDLKEVIDKFEKSLCDYECKDEEFVRNLDLYVAKALLNTFSDTVCKRVGAILSIMTEDV